MRDSTPRILAAWEAAASRLGGVRVEARPELFDDVQALLGRVAHVLEAQGTWRSDEVGVLSEHGARVHWPDGVDTGEVAAGYRLRDRIAQTPARVRVA